MPDERAGLLSGIDHLVLGVEDLSGAEHSFVRLGFRLTPRGDHERYGSHNSSIMFAEHYLEIFAFHDRDRWPTHPMLPVMDAIADGVVALAYSAQDIPRCDAWMRACFPEREISPVNRQDRAMAGDGGTAGFELGFLPAEVQHDFFGFYCRCLNPEILWRADWLDHPNAITRLRQMTLAIPSGNELKDTAARFTAIGLGDARVENDHVCEFTCPRGTIALETWESLSHRYPAHALGAARDFPWVASLTLETADMAVTQEYMPDGEGIQTLADGRLLIPASAAHGVMLEIVSQ